VVKVAIWVPEDLVVLLTADAYFRLKEVSVALSERWNLRKFECVSECIRFLCENAALRFIGNRLL
jgi:hypothetical protein